MDNFQHFISAHGPQAQLFFFIGLFIMIWNIENIAGVISNYKKWNHAIINVPFIFTGMPGQLILGLAFAKTIEWTSRHEFGFLYHLPIGKSSFLLFLISFIFLDFGEYVYHII